MNKQSFKLYFKRLKENIITCIFLSFMFGIIGGSVLLYVHIAKTYSIEWLLALFAGILLIVTFITREKRC